ncbi:MAG: carboxypeptidase-like regulatory domain-containing protein, partial [Acidobacteriota bacterium]
MVVCLFAAVNWASAQVNTADILGTVTDAGGAVIPNVKVTATNTATNITKTTTSGAAGNYVFNLMPSGTYVVTAEAPSFKRATVNLDVVSGDRARADMR